MNFFWLVWYRPRYSSGPKHWALFITFDTDDEAMGTIYQVSKSADPSSTSPLRQRKAEIIFDRALTLIVLVTCNDILTIDCIFFIACSLPSSARLAFSSLRSSPWQAEGNGWGTGQFKTSVIRGVQLRGERGSRAFESRFYLGDIQDSFMGAMQDYCEAATELINETNGKDFIGSLNCQDWCLMVIKSLEDSRCLKPGTHDKARSCSKDSEATITVCTVR